jgi:hypothetical protein
MAPFGGMASMSDPSQPFKLRHKFVLQTAAFLLIILPPLGLYWAVLAGITWAVYVLLTAVLAGVLLGLWVS